MRKTTLSLRAVWTVGCCVWKVTGKPITESFEVISNNHYDKTRLNQTRMKVTKLEALLDPATKAD